ncbi:MAG: cysteine desulfurase [Nitrososphaeria archaeon]
MDLESIRKDFHALSEGLIYLDNAATTLTPKPVIDALTSYYAYYRANPLRSIHLAARKAEDKLNEARHTCANFINASEKEIVFTRNTTEGLNMVANGLNLGEYGGNIVVTALEHHSNLLPWMRKCYKEGRELRIVFPKRSDGVITVDDVAEKIDEETLLVAFTHVSNVLGTILPVEDIVKVAHEHNTYTVLDAAQSVPHMKLDVKRLGVDFLALSGHKICGPTGSGILYIRDTCFDKVEPVFVGGGSIVDVETTHFTYAEPPSKFEAGTIAYCEAMALADALKYVSQIGFDNILSHDKKLIRLAHELIGDIKGLEIYGPSPNDKTSLLAFNINGLDPSEVAMILDSTSGIEVRSGHLCAQVCTKRVLGQPNGIVRVSSYFYNTEGEITKLADTIKHIVDTMVL